MNAVIEKPETGTKYKGIWPMKAYITADDGTSHFCEILRSGEDYAFYVSNRGKTLSIGMTDYSR